MALLKIFKTHPNVTIPRHQTTQSACFDLSYQGHGKSVCSGFTRMNKPVERLMNGSITISPGDRMMVPTGLILDIPEGYSVRVHARSGLSLKQGLVLANAEGVIDADYTQELMVLVHNISDNAITINNGDRIAQAELVPVIEYTVEETYVRPVIKGNRTGGMGSTGITTDKNVVKINIPETQVVTEKRGRGRPKKNVSTS